MINAFHQYWWCQKFSNLKLCKVTLSILILPFHNSLPINAFIFTSKLLFIYLLFFLSLHLYLSIFSLPSTHSNSCHHQHHHQIENHNKWPKPTIVVRASTQTHNRSQPYIQTTNTNPPPMTTWSRPATQTQLVPYHKHKHRHQSWPQTQMYPHHHQNTQQGSYLILRKEPCGGCVSTMEALSVEASWKWRRRWEREVEKWEWKSERE